MIIEHSQVVPSEDCQNSCPIDDVAVNIDELKSSIDDLKSINGLVNTRNEVDYANILDKDLMATTECNVCDRLNMDNEKMINENENKKEILNETCSDFDHITRQKKIIQNNYDIKFLRFVSFKTLELSQSRLIVIQFHKHLFVTTFLHEYAYICK